MRKITIDELPEYYRNQTLIKYDGFRSYKLAALKVKETHILCNSLINEAKEKIEEQKKENEKAAFKYGFSELFSQIIAFIEKYEEMQSKRFLDFKETLINSLSHSLKDPLIVEQVISYLKQDLSNQDELKIIIPYGTEINHINSSELEFTHDNSITIKSSEEIIRFPSDCLCQEWVGNADITAAINTNEMANVMSSFFIDVNRKLKVLDNNLDAQ